jgi:sulfur relay (sulfurtransferase) DsrC/TusE family protein
MRGITNTLQEQHTFFIITPPVLLGIRNISDKLCGENQNAFYIQQLFIFPKIVQFVR